MSSLHVLLVCDCTMTISTIYLSDNVLQPLRLNNVDENVAREIDDNLVKDTDKEEILRRVIILLLVMCVAYQFGYLDSLILHSLFTGILESSC